jgi:CMP-N,N'-diacetyllegionaminic acid synthase
VIDDARVLALIVARGGSKGLPGKNVADVGGVPMIAWSVRAALGSRHVDSCVLSSDDSEISNAARAEGCEVPFVRPSELATDEVGSLPVLRHAVEHLAAAGRHYDYVVLLQATSPLRVADDVDAALELCHAQRAPACVSVCKVEKGPAWMFSVDPNRHLLPALGEAPRPPRRQDLPPIVVLNGAIYVARTEWILTHEGFIGPDTVAYEMPRSRSIDIDDEVDLATCRALLNER